MPPGESIWNHLHSRRSRRPRRSTISQVNNMIQDHLCHHTHIKYTIVPIAIQMTFSVWRITLKSDTNDRLSWHFSHKMLLQSSTYYVSVLSLALTFANFPWLSFNFVVIFVVKFGLQLFLVHGCVKFCCMWIVDWTVFSSCQLVNNVVVHFRPCKVPLSSLQ